MTRSRIALAAATALALHGCSSPTFGVDRIDPIRMVPIPPDRLLVAVAGHGDLVAGLEIEDPEGIPPPPIRYAAILHAWRIDAAAPAELLDVGDLPVDGLTVERLDGLGVTGDSVTIVADDQLAAISLGPAAPQVIATFPASAATHAIASGRWLLRADPAGAGASVLTLRDLGAAGFPEVGAPIDAGGWVTALAEGVGGFHVFTDVGLGHLSLDGGAPSYQHVASDGLRSFSKAHLDGTKLHAATPLPPPYPYVCNARVARIDVSNPAAPVVEASAESPACDSDFAYDGAGAYAVLSWGSVWMFRESGGAIVPPPVGRPVPVARGSSVAHARSGLLYASYATATSGPPRALAVLELP